MQGFRSTQPDSFRATHGTGFCSAAFLFALAVLALSSATRAADPHIDRVERLGTNLITIHFDTDANRTYALQYRIGISSTNWIDHTEIGATPFPNHYVMVDSITNSSVRFYRLRVTP
jgi:hypothetical protein